jgi:hypothetical protein
MRMAGIALLVLAFSGCGRGVITHWEDGSYLVYTRPASQDIIIGHDMGDGAILGLSDPTVVSAGSNPRYVVFSRKPISGGIEHFYIVKIPDTVGEVSGPFTPDDYKVIATRLALPEFSWHLRQP